MSDMVTARNISALISPRVAAPITAITAGGAGDATAISGLAIDRGALKMPLSAALVISFTATLAATKTLSLGTVKMQDSADGSTFADYSALSIADPGVVATGPTGGGTVNGQVVIPIPLAGMRQYVKPLFTPDLSATGTDTAMVSAILVFGGFDRSPAP